MRAQQQMLDRIEGDRPQAQGLSRSPLLTSASENVSSSRSTCTYSRRPRFPSRASICRRSSANSSGNSQPCSGAAWSSALVFCSSSAR